MSTDNISRRKFVAGTTGAALGAMIVPRHVLGGPGYTAPSDKVNIAVVGCGGQGASDASELLANGQNIVALADVDFDYVDKAMAGRVRNRDGKPNENMVRLQEAYNKAKRYADFRKLIETEKGIDGVIVATPDHTHAIVAKTAMEAGKAVYVEKPLTWSVHESRVLREVAARTKVATQMGNHGHSSDAAARVNEWIQAGVLGAVREVHIWTNRPIWPQGVPRPLKPAAPWQGGGGFGNEWTARRLNRAISSAVVGDYSIPASLNWDLYLGPAPQVDYHPIYHPFNWRGWVEWGTGALGDMAAHLMDHPYWALGLTYPTSVEATSTPWGLGANNALASYPLSSKATYHYPARGNQPAVKLTWLDGGLMPDRPALMPDNVQLDPGGGVIYIGEKGILMHETYGYNPKLYPESLVEVANKVPRTYPRVEMNDDADKSAKHRLNWAKAIMGKEKTTCPIEYASRLTENMLLGVVALKTGQGRKITYDGATGRVTNIPEANQYLQREYREGWKL